MLSSYTLSQNFPTYFFPLQKGKNVIPFHIDVLEVMNDIFSIFSLPAFAGSLIIGSLFLTGLSLLFLVLFFRKQRVLEQKLDFFFSGKDAKTLETVLAEQLSETKALDRDIQALYDAVEKLRALSLRSLHKHYVLRFNPFKEVGGNQSFSVAFLDGTDSGVVLSSLHTREGTRIYAKPVEKGRDKGFPFTEEEKEVVRKAAALKVLP